MARELVITSVPRGVRPGRTGFQIAMRTAGLREDVCNQLESLGVYRHLPPGAGANPVCYFHKIVQTGIGPLQVLGRVVDAGADYSSRSNKLAHLVALDASDLGALRSSSPAAALLAIEGRLAQTWPGGPEERQHAFVVNGVPGVTAGVCRLWQETTGDAGWGGVLAEQAARNKSVLVIAPDSSPQWCRRLLQLFDEALALVPVSRRWSVTFDTTVLSPNAPLTWRGTYAGSPESGVSSPGLIVINLAQRPGVPDDMASLPLVQQARHGVHATETVQRPTQGPTQGPTPGRTPTTPPPFPAGTVPDDKKPPGRVVPPPPSRIGPRPVGPGHVYEKRNDWQAWVAGGVLAVVLLLAIAVGLFFMFDVPGQINRNRAAGAIAGWATMEDGKPPARGRAPTVEQWLAVHGQSKGDGKGEQGSLDRGVLERVLPLLNECLLTSRVTPEAVKDRSFVDRLIASLTKLQAGEVDAAALAEVGLNVPEAATVPWLVELVNERLKAASAAEPPEPITLATVQEWIDTVQPLATLSNDEADATGRARPSKKDIRKALGFLLRDEEVRKHIEALTDGLVARRALPKDVTTLADVRMKLGDLAKKGPEEGTEKRPEPNPPESKPPIQSPATAEPKTPPKQDENRDAGWNAFVESVGRGRAVSNRWPKPQEPIDVVTAIPKTIADVNWGEVKLVLGRVGDVWKPEARRPDPSKREWQLEGLPIDPKVHWGTIRLVADGDTFRLVFEAEPAASWICGWVPIVFEGPMNQRTPSLRVAPKARSLPWAVEGPSTWADLAGMSGDAQGGRKTTLTVEADPPWLATLKPTFDVKPVDHKPGVEPRVEISTDVVTATSTIAERVVFDRFRLDIHGTTLSATIQPENQARWAERYNKDQPEIKDLNKVSMTVWKDLVFEVLEAEISGLVSTKADIGKRIGVDDLGINLETARKKLEELRGLPANDPRRKQQLPGLENNYTEKVAEKDAWSPWVVFERNDQKQPRALHEWKEQAVGYVMRKDSMFLAAIRRPKNPEKPTETERKAEAEALETARQAARNPVAVRAFLAEHAEWRERVEGELKDKNASNDKTKSKSEQNELLALLVLASIDNYLAAAGHGDAVTAAFHKPVSDTLEATVTVTWSIEGGKGEESMSLGVGARVGDP